MASDPDTPEWTDEENNRARPGSEVLPADFIAILESRRARMRTPRNLAQKRVTLFLDDDVFNYLQAEGPDWQARLNDTLRKAVGL